MSENHIARAGLPVSSRRFVTSAQNLAFRVLAGVGALVVVALGAFVGPVAPAAAAPMSSITIDRVSASPQESGNTFNYEVQYQCSDVDGAACFDNVITIPLGAAAGFDVDVSTAAPVASWQVVGNNLVITLDQSIDAGASSTIQVRLTPPNNVTPDGTTWSLLPTVTGSNTPTASAPEPADGVATAVLTPTIAKEGTPGFAQAGDTVTWTIDVACSLRDSGSLFAEAMTVTDPLPAGFEFVSASGGGSYNAG